MGAALPVEFRPELLRISDWVNWCAAELRWDMGDGISTTRVVVYECGSERIVRASRGEERIPDPPAAEFEATERGWMWANMFCNERRKEEYVRDG